MAKRNQGEAYKVAEMLTRSAAASSVIYGSKC
jgi:hypothetical protein